MEQQHQAHLARLGELLEVIHATRDMRARSTLFKFYRNCSDCFKELDREMVNCRRTHRVTPKYTDLLLQLDNSMEEFEQWITFSKLLY
mgnify:CR=1 FL=1